MNEFGKYRLFRKYVSYDGVNYTPLDEYQALLVENNSCQCGYRELEYRFDGEYKNETFKKYEIWNEYSFCPNDSSYDELTGNVDYRNPIPNEGVLLTTYRGNGSNYVKLCYKDDFFQSMVINNVELKNKHKQWKFNNTSINEVAFLDVTSIGNQSFKACEDLKSVVIPDSVTSIGDEAFSICSGLTSVKIGSGVTSIGNYVFSDCSGLTSVVIPDSVTSIGEYAFLKCAKLKSVTIGSGLTTIGIWAFRSCNKLTSITCYATTAPTLYGYSSVYLPKNGILKVPNGSDYSSWLSILGSTWTIEYI